MYVCPARLSSSPISHSNKLHRRLREPIGSHFSQPSSYLINYLSTLGPLSRARRELLQPPRILQGPPKPSCRRASPRDRERSFLRRSASPRDRQRRTITTMMATTQLTTTNLPRYHRTGVKPTKDTVDAFCKALYSAARGKLSPVDPLGHLGLVISPAQHLTLSPNNVAYVEPHNNRRPSTSLTPPPTHAPTYNRLPVVSVGIEWLQDGEGRLVGGWVDGHSR